MYTCETCQYKTKHKSSLKRHILLHTANSEVKMYTCETRNVNRILKIIFLTHRENSEVEMYACQTCHFETKHKGNLKIHLLTHRENSELEMYTCETCQYKTKHKSSLKIHLLTHSEKSELEMYECETCHFKTKRKDHLKSHFFTHRENFEIEVIAKPPSTQTVLEEKAVVGADIPTSTKEEATLNLKNHSLVHRRNSKGRCIHVQHVILRQNMKSVLKDIFLIHREISEVDFYTCEMCKFKTKYKNSLKRHILVHRK
ncbi:hypothetical protein NQ317_004147 [Molorchus minor]|uniref:C2H2-type domain-containing protein n=1 Tax=Molorchus minor TaxID=1323400 RepID=A0ABQ9J6S8_9CUCU|nr:hypothetical protein NQ317_004147 [Molorchus minor]